MGSVCESVPGIFRITQRLNRFKFSVHIYVIAGRNGLVFDSGFGSRRMGHSLIRDISSIAGYPGQEYFKPVRAMASHSHWDHFSGLARLQSELGIEILGTRAQARRIGSREDYNHFFWANQEMFALPGDPALNLLNFRNRIFNRLMISLFQIRFVPGKITTVQEFQKLSAGGRQWTIIPVPGHCDDDIALFQPDTGILLGGDLVLRHITTWLGPMKSDLKTYIRSLETIRDLPGLKLILPAHGAPVENPRRRIQAVIDHRHKRTRQIFDLVARRGRCGISFKKIYRSIYPGHRSQSRLLGGWIVITLKYLVEKGDIRVEHRGHLVFFKS